MEKHQKIALKRNFLYVGLFLFFIFGVIPTFLKPVVRIIKEDNMANPYYYCKGIIKEKYVEDGLFGVDMQYLKLELADGTKEVVSVKTEQYLLAEENEEVFVILDEDKKEIKEILFNHREFDAYVEDKKEVSRSVKAIE